MIIKIDDDFAKESIINGLSEDELLQISRLYQLMAEKKLFVRVDDRDFLVLLLEKYIEYFSKFAINVMKNVLSNFYSTMSTVKQLDCLFTVTKNSLKYCDDNCDSCSIPLKDLPDELCPYFYAENDEDSRFYFTIFKETGPKYPVYIRCRGFGGGSGKGVIKSLIKDKTIFFAVIDSDKEYRNGATGSTAKSIKPLFKKDRLFWKHYILNVREKENLLPIDSILIESNVLPLVLECILNNKVDEIVEHFDIKSGIDEESYFRKSSVQGWCRVHHPIIDYLENTKRVIFPDSNKKGISGVGDSFISRLLEDHNIDFSTILRNCTTRQYEDWNNIFKQIIKYGYCYDYITS